MPWRYRYGVALSGRGMRVILQRVSMARVARSWADLRQIGPGLLVLAGFSADEAEADLDWMAQKIVRLRLRRRRRDEPRYAAGRRADSRRLPIHAVRVDEEGQSSVGGRAARGECRNRCSTHFVGKLATGIRRPVPTGVFSAICTGSPDQ